MATGLLIVGVGVARKQLGMLLGLDKSYDAEIILGQSTDSGDIDGDIMEEKDASHLTNNAIHLAVSSLVGNHRIAVPLISAVKINGTRLYRYARRHTSEGIEPPLKYMNVHMVSLSRMVRVGNRIIVSVSFSVSSGTYIRSLATELGKRLFIPTHLLSLRRTRIGSVHIREAIPFEQVSPTALRTYL